MAAPVADDRRAIAGIHPACSTNEPLALEVLQDASGVLLRGGDDGVQRDLRVLRRLVRVIDAGERRDLAAPGLRVDALLSRRSQTSNGVSTKTSTKRSSPTM